MVKIEPNQINHDCFNKLYKGYRDFVIKTNP